MNGGNWGGSSTKDAEIEWAVEVFESKAGPLYVKLQIPAGYSGYHVAHALTTLWNEEYPDGPSAVSDGSKVRFAGEINALRVNGEKLPDDGSGVEPVPGLFVHSE